MLIPKPLYLQLYFNARQAFDDSSDRNANISLSKKF